MSKKIIDKSEDAVYLNIPERDIWTYQVEGLAAPRINKTPSHYNLKKLIFILVIVVAVSLSCFFSIMALFKDTFEYEANSDGYTFTRFSNNGFIREIEIDYVSKVETIIGNPDPKTNFKIAKDSEKPITAIGSYVLNCDDKVLKITIGANVTEIADNAFYSCWALREIQVDENNPNYSSIDGVLYNKDATEIICRPCDHDTYLAEKYGHAEYAEDDTDRLYRIEPAPDSENYEQYVKDVLTFVIPSSVERVGQLCFNYSNMINVYIPEGVTVIETLGFYEIPLLQHVYTYKSAAPITNCHYTSDEALGEVYYSLPEGLVEIGSDAFTECRQLQYVYIPASVKSIGHHAFWDTVMKEDGELKGVTCINVAADEATFDSLEVGTSWRPQYDYLLFKKSVDINYSAQREAKP